MKKIVLLLSVMLSYQIRRAQDPMRTPVTPKLTTSGTVDGSNGKYVSEHKVRKSNFVKHRLHIKKLKAMLMKRQERSMHQLNDLA